MALKSQIPEQVLSLGKVHWYFNTTDLTHKEQTYPTRQYIHKDLHDKPREAQTGLRQKYKLPYFTPQTKKHKGTRDYHQGTVYCNTTGDFNVKLLYDEFEVF